MASANIAALYARAPAANRLRRWALLLTLVAWWSLTFDGLGVISRGYFAGQPTGSEELVLDGIVAYVDAAGPVSPLGRFVRGDGSVATVPEMRHNFDARVGGRYLPYDSQYGLQGYLWRAVHLSAGASIDAMHALNTALLSVLLGLSFLLLARPLGVGAAVAFVAATLTAPWMVMFAADLYWMAWTWFLPMVVVLAACCGRPGASPIGVPVLAAYFLAMLVKLLCGYEYATTVVIASFCPLLIPLRRRPFAPVRAVREMIVLGLVSIAAFVVAIGCHALRLEESGTQAGSGSAMAQIRNLAEKRLHSGNPREIAKQACQDDFWQDPECETLFVESLNARPLAVVGQYVIGARQMIPWIARLEEISPSEAFRTTLRQALEGSGLAGALSVMREMPAQAAPYLARALNTLALLALTAAAFARVLLPAFRDPARAMLLLVAFSAPLSWFVAAKGHSYIHVGLNHVLWYVPFVPFACAMLFARRDARRQPPLGRPNVRASTN